MTDRPKLCGINAAGGSIGYAGCDLPWGHEGDMHANAGDGFYARQHDAEHHRRQREVKPPPSSWDRIK